MIRKESALILIQILRAFAQNCAEKIGTAKRKKNAAATTVDVSVVRSKRVSDRFSLNCDKKQTLVQSGIQFQTKILHGVPLLLLFTVTFAHTVMPLPGGICPQGRRSRLNAAGVRTCVFTGYSSMQNRPSKCHF